MHGPHQIQPSRQELDPRVHARKPASAKDESAAYGRVSERSDDANRQGARRGPPQRRDEASPPPKGPQSGLLKARPNVVMAREPFRAVSSTTKVWAALVMADMECFDDQKASKAEPKANEALNDLFAQAVK